jgi:hypothetical protein
MRTWKSVIVSALSGLVLVGALTITLWPRSFESMETKYKKISIGMARAEVETIIGTPPTSIYVERPPWPFLGKFTQDPPASTSGGEWDDGRQIIQIGFSNTDLVTECHFCTRLNILDSILDWLNDQRRSLL